jgi:hypothetical protein
MVVLPAAMFMFTDEKLTPAGLLLILVEKAPRCRCGGNCETLQYMANMFREMKKP